MKKACLFLSVLFLGGMMLASCGGNDATKENVENKETSEENNEPSNEVTIGKQVWMNKNLDVEVFQNGDKIPEAKTGEEWFKASENGEPAWCYYKYNPDNGDRHGKLYNWYAVNDPRGLAPKGWKIPSYQDWMRLSDFLGGNGIKKLKSSDFWSYDANGTNEVGFNATPGGYIRLNDFMKESTFDGLNSQCYFWSTDDHEEQDEPFERRKGNQIKVISIWGGDEGELASELASRAGKGEGLSVRCIKK